MSATARRTPGAEIGPLRSVPLARPVREPSAASLHPVAAPEPIVGPIPGIAPPSARELAERAVRNAEAGLREAEHRLSVARRGIGEANRTHTEGRFDRRGRVVTAPRPFTAERVRERKAAAFRFLNSRRVLVRDALRRVAEARAALAPLAASWGRGP